MISSGNKSLYIVGTTTLSEIIFDIARREHILIIGFIDDFSKDKYFHGIQIVGTINHIINNKKRFQKHEIFVAIGDNKNRKKIYNRFKNNDFSLPNIIDSHTSIEKSCQIGQGNLIYGPSYIGTNTIIGNGNLIFPGVIITHHNKIDSYNHISPNISIAGHTTLGSGCKIGMNTVIAPYLKIPDDFCCPPLSFISKDNL